MNRKLYFSKRFKIIPITWVWILFFMMGFVGAMAQDLAFTNMTPRDKVIRPELDKNPNLQEPYIEVGLNSKMAEWDHLFLNGKKEGFTRKTLEELDQLTHQILFQYLERVYRKCHHSYNEKEKNSFRRNSQMYSQILTDITLLSAYENALVPNFQVFYLSRWNLYRDYIQQCLDQHKKLDTAYIHHQMKDLEKTWMEKFKLQTGRINSPPNPKTSLIQWEKTLKFLYNRYIDIKFWVE